LVQVLGGIGVQLQHTCDGVEHFGGRRTISALFETPVVRRTDPGEKGEFFTSEPWDTASSCVADAVVCRVGALPPRPQEVAEGVTDLVHVPHRTSLTQLAPTS